jgi:hypothetical protein
MGAAISPVPDQHKQESRPVRGGYLRRLRKRSAIIILMRAHCVRQYVIRHFLSEHVPPNARSAEVNTPEDTRVGDFRDRA